ncbi:hypothetical protein [Planomonospora algeriensis]
MAQTAVQPAQAIPALDALEDRAVDGGLLIGFGEQAALLERTD